MTRIHTFLNEENDQNNTKDKSSPKIDEDDVNIQQMYQEMQETQPSSTEEYLKILGNPNTTSPHRKIIYFRPSWPTDSYDPH